jgi:hypothetical protein
VPTEPRSGLSLELFKPVIKPGVGGCRTAQLDERTHDLDIDCPARLLRSTPESIATPCSVKT